MKDAPVIVVHSLAQAIAALEAAAEAGRAIVLASAPEAGVYAGPGWWRALVAAARKAVPVARFSALLDCGDEPDAALAAIRAGVEGVAFTGRADVAARLADLARNHAVRLATARPTVALDLDFLDADNVLAERLASVVRVC